MVEALPPVQGTVITGACPFPVELTEIKGHTHDYYGRSSSINKEAWAFLQKQRLEGEPKYQEYNIR